MASLKLAEIQHANAEGFLLPGKGLVQSLMLSGLSSKDQVELLLKQTSLALARKKPRNWLVIVAKEAHELQFHDASWIDTNIHRVHRQRKSVSAMPAEPSRDIRLKENPKLPVIVTNEGSDDTSDITDLTKQIDSILCDLSGDKVSTTSVLPSTSTDQSSSAEPSSMEDSSCAMEVVASPPRRSPRSFSPLKIMSSPVRRSPRNLSPQKKPASTVSRKSSPAKRPSSRRRSPKSEIRAPLKRHPRRDSTRGRDYYRRDDRDSRSSRKEDSSARRTVTIVKRARNDRRDHSSSQDIVPSKRQRLDRLPRARVDTGLCPVPGCGSHCSREHAFGVHLPAILDERRGLTPEITRSRVNLLIKCTTRIMGGLDVSVLSSYIDNLQMITKGCFQFTRQMFPAMTELCHEMGLPVPTSFTIDPFSSPAVLMHWRVFLVVMGCLDRSSQRELREDFPSISVPLQERPQAFDSHFHLDRIRRKMGNNRPTYTDVLGAVQPEGCDEVWITGGIAVFCDPKSYPSQEEVISLTNNGVGVAIGLHPRNVMEYTDKDWDSFQTCLGFQGVRALGEVGLDQFKTDPNSWDQQHEVLNRALQSLTPEKVLVLHNRGQNSEMWQLLYHLKGIVPTDQRIHMHCYSGNSRTRDLWIQSFPNTHFGFTALVNSFNPQQREALKGLDQDRLLLETDAPYFTPDGQSFSTPVLLGTTARLVADIRNQPWEEVLGVSEANARRLYQMPSQ